MNHHKYIERCSIKSTQTGEYGEYLAVRAIIGVQNMTMLYGNLADAALGDLRFAQNVHRRLKSAALKPLKPLKPVPRLLIGLVLAVIGLTALVVLGDAPDRFTAATPVIADLEDWLVWRDFQSF